MNEPETGESETQTPLIEREDEELVALVARGDEWAFEVLLNRYQKGLLTFCYGFMRDRQRAEDMAQETFLRMFRNAYRYKPVARFSTWIYRIAANLCINELKKLKLRQAISIDQPLSMDPESTKVVEKMAADARQPLTEAEEMELQGLLEEAIKHLPEDQRSTLIMVEFHHMPYREIARILGITVSAVKMRIKRARENLRHMLRFLEHE
jgi:RNA polymerase sigma-70 factor (ECF subfamily)